MQRDQDASSMKTTSLSSVRNTRFVHDQQCIAVLTIDSHFRPNISKPLLREIQLHRLRYSHDSSSIFSDTIVIADHLRFH